MIEIYEAVIISVSVNFPISCAWSQELHIKVDEPPAGQWYKMEEEESQTDERMELL